MDWRIHNLRNAFKRSQLAWVEDITHHLAHQTRLLFEQDRAFNEFMRQQLERQPGTDSG